MNGEVKKNENHHELFQNEQKLFNIWKSFLNTMILSPFGRSALKPIERLYNQTLNNSG